MNKDQSIGVIILVASVVGILVYAWLIYTFPLIVLQITASLAVAAVLVILAWIGWTMATTPPPTPLEPEPTSPEPSTTAEKQA
jgi:predicted DNA-binding transcriptional regulator